MARPARKDVLSVSQLETLLARRKSEIGDLSKERSSLQKKIDAIDDRLRQLGGGAGGRGGPGRSRARNDRSLVDVMEEVLAKTGKAMRVSEISDNVQATGYRSTSANFRSIVNQMLIKDKRFNSPARGLYQLKK